VLVSQPRDRATALAKNSAEYSEPTASAALTLGIPPAAIASSAVASTITVASGTSLRHCASR